MTKLRATIACLGLSAGLMAGAIAASPAGAATVSVLPGHFQCSPTTSSRWVKQYWPNMKSAKGGVENTYFGAKLQYWTGSTWKDLSWSGWYAGLSGPNGRIAVANGAFFSYLNGNIPYPMDGIRWSVTPGYNYRTIEYYSWPSIGLTTTGAVSYVGTHAGPAGGSQYCYVR